MPTVPLRWRRSFRRRFAITWALVATGALATACTPASTGGGPRNDNGFFDPVATKAPPAPDPDPVGAANDPGGGSPGEGSTMPGAPAPGGVGDAGIADARAQVVPPATPGGPRVDGAAAPAVPTPPVPGAAATPCTLHFTATTISFGGNYAPKNVGAIWVATGGDVFVKTLRIWGNARRKYLSRWQSVSGANLTDAVTGATEPNHGARAVTWSCTGIDGKVVPDGPYRVFVEFTERDGPGRVRAYDFAKGPAPFSAMPPDEVNMKAISLQVGP
jgi:hypothetical protein